nr:ubiquitin carboxyl-terminal hydrolase 25 [Ipomoea batatas]
MEVLKKELMKEASSVLRSCGWTDNVYSLMRSKKRLCVRGDSNGTSDYDEEKRLLIADAKATFISQIPESLKSSLIKHLRSFHQENT